MRRVIGVVVSIALVGVGTLLLVGYVSGAEERALAGEELVGVLVVDQEIEVGAAVEDIADAVRFELVPVKVRVEGAVDGLEDLAGLVTSSGLLPGEQITTSRFADPASLLVHQPVEHRKQFLDIREMKPRGRLVQYVKGFARGPAAELGGQFHALGLPSGKCR